MSSALADLHAASSCAADHLQSFSDLLSLTLTKVELATNDLSLVLPFRLRALQILARDTTPALQSAISAILLVSKSTLQSFTLNLTYNEISSNTVDEITTLTKLGKLDVGAVRSGDLLRLLSSGLAMSSLEIRVKVGRLIVSDLLECLDHCNMSNVTKLVISFGRQVPMTGQMKAFVRRAKDWPISFGTR